MKWFSGLTWRSALFGVGAIGAVAEAIDIAMRDDMQVTPAHLIAVGCVALLAFAAKWPGDLTKDDARDLEARVKRESIFPPPGDNS